MSVRDSRSIELLVGSRSKARALLALRDGPGTLAELTARAQVSKSALRVALGNLERASVVVRRQGRYRLSEAGEEVAAAMLTLEAEPAATVASLASYAGQWVAVDADDQLIAASADPKALVAELRRRQIVAKRLWRVSEPGRHFEGANVG
jgi:DNA-binding HxlR family transcriptional regulator